MNIKYRKTGELADVVSGLLMVPEIAEKITVIWIGGATYPKGFEDEYSCNKCNFFFIIRSVSDIDEYIQTIWSISGRVAVAI